MVRGLQPDLPGAHKRGSACEAVPTGKAGVGEVAFEEAMAVLHAFEAGAHECSSPITRRCMTQTLRDERGIGAGEDAYSPTRSCDERNEQGVGVSPRGCARFAPTSHAWHPISDTSAVFPRRHEGGIMQKAIGVSRRLVAKRDAPLGDQRCMFMTATIWEVRNRDQQP